MSLELDLQKQKMRVTDGAACTMTHFNKDGSVLGRSNFWTGDPDSAAFENDLEFIPMFKQWAVAADDETGKDWKRVVANEALALLDSRFEE